MSGLESGSYQDIRKRIDHALTDKDFTNRIVQSVNGVVAVVNAIVETKGENWAVHVVDEKGQPLLTPEEQQRFTEAFSGHIDGILAFFGQSRTQKGGAMDITLPSLVEPSDEPELTTESNAIQGIDESFSQKFMKRINNVDQVVNDYASKYGILKLQREHDVQPDIRLIPEPAAMAISQGVFTLGSMMGFPIPPNVTMEFLAKIKVPFRTVIFTVYVALDVARISMGFAGRENGRKILSVLLAILELMLGDWKKSILTFMGYYGMSPMLYGELGKVFLTSFRMFAPQLQDTFLLGTFDATKSFVVGLLLSLFQITAPEEVRLPLVAALQKVAHRKAEINGVLQGEGLPARPEYLSPSFEDLNNIQAVMSDTAYLCSCEFQELVEAVDKSSMIRTVLQILRIPVTKEFIEFKCGPGPCKPFVTRLVENTQALAKPQAQPEAKPEVQAKAQEQSQQETATSNELPTVVAPVVQPEAPVVQPEAPVVQPEAPVVQPEAPVVQPEAQPQTPTEPSTTTEPDATLPPTQEPPKRVNEIRRGGRILHSRRNRVSLA
jgi:hypothetical protein